MNSHGKRLNLNYKYVCMRAYKSGVTSSLVANFSDNIFLEYVKIQLWMLIMASLLRNLTYFSIITN